MTAPLHDLLDEVADGVVRPLPAADPRVLWAAGRRRRARRVQRLAAGLVVVLLAVLLVPVGVVRSPAQWAGPSTEAVTGFPAQIGRQWWVRPLPERPGPLALLVQGGPAFPLVWYGVAPDGRRWRLPEVSHRTDQYPTLSPDGRLLGHLATEDGPYVLHDLVTGERTVVEDVADNREQAQAEHRLQGQAPTHWAPDGSRALLPALEPVLLDAADGRLRSVARPGGSVTPAGFAGPDRLVWLRTGGARGLVSTVEAVVTDLDGRELRTLPLSPAPDPTAVLSQWSGVVSPDGLSLAVVAAGTGSDLGSVVRYDLGDGSVSGPAVAAPVEPVCPSAWGERLVVPAGASYDRGDASELSLAVDGGGTEPVVVVEDRDELRCAVWASGALAAGGGQALLGTSTAWLSWWWPEVLLGLLVAGLLVLARVQLRGSTPRRGLGRRRGRGGRAATDWYA